MTIIHDMKTLQRDLLDLASHLGGEFCKWRSRCARHDHQRARRTTDTTGTHLTGRRLHATAEGRAGERLCISRVSNAQRLHGRCATLLLVADLHVVELAVLTDEEDALIRRKALGDMRF